MSIVVLDFWVSPFAARVKIALAEKGVSYERREEDILGVKSDLLLKSNPIYGKVPVLLHDGKPICESINIVYYIDETFTSSPQLLPTSSYDRSKARFWADFIDKKVFETGSKIWRGNGEEIEVATKEFLDILKTLEGAIEGKEFFGGDNFGFLDIILIPLTSWFYSYKKFGGFKIEEECPKLTAWIKRCLERKSVADALPNPEKVWEFVTMMRKVQGIE